MNDEALNGSIREFLKTVRVNSLLAIKKGRVPVGQQCELKGDGLLPPQSLVTS
jgi:hypothetical protein